jgi:hypothetical protein
MKVPHIYLSIFFPTFILAVADINANGSQDKILPSYNQYLDTSDNDN